MALNYTIKSKLATKLLRYAFGFYLIFAILITTFQLVMEFYHEEQLVDKEINDLLKSFKPYLARSLWEVDYPHVKSIMQGILKNESVVGVYLEDDAHEPLPAIGIIKNNKNEIINTESKKNTTDLSDYINMILYQYDFVLFHTNEYEEKQIVGYGKIFSSTGIVLNRVKYSLFLTLINAFIKTTILWIIFFVSIKYLVSNPLKKLTDLVDSFKPGDIKSIDEKIKIVEDFSKSNDELGLFIKKFDEMRKTIIKKDFQLNQSNKHLESIVYERTKELNKTCSQLKAASEIKNEFMANMSHEILTPINGINGMISLILSSKNLDPKVRNYAEIAKASSQNLVTMVHDILDFSKIEAGKFKIEISDFNIFDFLIGLKENYSHKAQEKNLGFALNIDKNIPKILYGDSQRLKQILTNLIENAIKFTDKGLITIDAAVNWDNDNELEISFRIKDTGIGIPKEYIENMFNSFSQYDSSSTRKYGGVGLGLAISKQLAELMAGNITVESTPGQGSIFTFNVKLLKKIEINNIESIKKSKNNNIKILLSEDNIVDQAVIVAMLKSRGLNVDVVRNGKELIKLLQFSYYDLIIVNEVLPDIKVNELLKKIREKNNKFSQIPVIVMIDYSSQADTQNLLENGINDYITKPVQPEIILEKIEKLALETIQ